MKLLLVATLTSFTLIFAGACVHQAPREFSVTTVSNNVVVPQAILEPVALRLVGENGREEINNNCSISVTKTFDDDQISHKRVESVDFKSRTVTVKVDPKGHIFQNIDVVSKEGSTPLHDLAFPEMGEVIDFEFSPVGEVFHAASYPKSSLFFVPPLPLPQKPVKKGDQWELKSGWASEDHGLPLTVVLHARFIGQQVCGDHMCINVGVEGEVHMKTAVEKKNGFGHKITGRYLFEPVRGLLVWSEFASDEHLQAEGARAEVHSLLRSELVSPPGYRTVNHEEPSCPFETKVE